MDSRTQILRNIRLALAKPSSKPHHGTAQAPTDVRELFSSAYGDRSLVEKFGKELERVSGEFVRCNTKEEVLERIRELITSSHFTRVVISNHPICQQLNLQEKLSLQIPQVHFLREQIDIDSAFERSQLRQPLSNTQLSITGVEYLIADIGSIVVLAGSQASRQISLLPTVHLALASNEQIYPNMAELFLEIHREYGEQLPTSALTLITGPSRTADIEKVLIKGVHGPNRLVAMVLEESG